MKWRVIKVSAIRMPSSKTSKRCVTLEAAVWNTTMRRTTQVMPPPRPIPSRGSIPSTSLTYSRWIDSKRKPRGMKRLLRRINADNPFCQWSIQVH
jgi:hypothetical protein